MPILVPEVQRVLPEPEKKARSGGTPKPQQTPTLMPPTRRGARFGLPSASPEPQPVAEKPKPVKAKREKVKADPAHVAAARELRDRWLEQVNAAPMLQGGQGKYDVSRQLAGAADAIAERPVRLLGAA